MTPGPVIGNLGLLTPVGAIGRMMPVPSGLIVGPGAWCPGCKGLVVPIVEPGAWRPDCNDHFNSTINPGCND